MLFKNGAHAVKDQFNRTINYIRISVTDRCNLRCRYCMPDGVPLSSMDDLLTFEEIAAVVRAAACLGIKYVKLTGGEPLIRRGLAGLIKMLREIEGIEQITLTTNGTMLEERLEGLVQAGLDAVNISLDTLDPDTFFSLTGTASLDKVLSAIDAACASGIRTKINAVSLDRNRDDLMALINLAKDRPLDVRFIEMMPIGCGKQYPGVSHEKLLDYMFRIWPALQKDDAFHGFGPAVYYHPPGFLGSIGLISAIHGKFCSSCNRVRLTSKGYLKPCLCYDQGTDLRAVLRSSAPPDEKKARLKEALSAAIYEKPMAHCFEDAGHITENGLMSAIGG